MEEHHMSHLTGGQILRTSVLKLLFEGIGAMFLTLAFDVSQKQGFGANQVTCLLVLWVLTIFGFKISGAHYNPAISFSFMLRKDVGNFPRILGFAYIGAQIGGGFIGALISWFLFVDENPLLSGFDTAGMVFPKNHGDGEANRVFANMLAETLGTFFVCFFYLTQTEEKTMFSKEKAINCFIIASSYVGARGMLNGQVNCRAGQVLNPAIAIGTSFVQLFAHGADKFKYVWLYGLFPFGGALLAVLFHEFFYKKSQEVLEDADMDEDNDTLLDK